MATVLAACAETSAARPQPAAQTDAVSSVPAPLARSVELRKVVSGLSRPLGLEFAPGDRSGRLFIVEQRGTIRVLHDGEVEESPWLDLRGEVSRGHNEQGLLGLAFHPKFATNRKFYVNYTNKRGDTRVVEFRVAKKPSKGGVGHVDESSARLVFELDQPFGNHNGGDIEFGPDGKLYIGTGDGGAAGDPKRAGQDDDQLLAKMIRIDVDAGGSPEIVSKGLRNPWRYHFDPGTGDLYIGDVGQNKWEEIDVVPFDDIEGANFGWSILEGNHCYRPRRGCKRKGMVAPVVEYDHSTGCSVTGGQVYRGSAIPELDGVYFYADYCTAIVRSFRWSAEDGLRDHWDWKPVLDPRFRLATISTFGSDAAGELYILSLDGVLYKLAVRQKVSP